MPIAAQLINVNSKGLVKVPVGVRLNRGKTQPIMGYAPLGNVVYSNHQIGYKTIPLDNTPATAFANSSKLTMKLDAKSFDKIRHATLEVTIVESGGVNSVQVCPLPYFFSRILIKPNAGSAKEIQTIYPEQWHLSLACVSDDKLKTLLPSANFNSSWWTNPQSIPASQSRTYGCPLISSWFDVMKPNFQHVENDLWIEFYCQPITVAGSGTASLSSLKLIIGTEALSNVVEADELKMWQSPRSQNYVDVVRVEEAGVTLTAATKRTINLENLVGKYAGLVVLIRSGSSYVNVAGNSYDFYDLGPNGNFDIEDQSGKSLYGNGSVIPADYFRSEVFHHHFPSSLARKQAFYVLPFCDSVPAAVLKGEISGFMEFDGSPVRLAITPSAAGVSQVDTLNCNNPANDGGYYAMALESNTDEIKYDTVAATMKSQLEALPELREENGLTVTASAALTTDATLTWSTRANKLEGNPGDRWGPVKVISSSLADGGVGEFVSSTVSTAGVRGWTTGTYTVSVYGLKYVNSVVADGQIMASDC